MSERVSLSVHDGIAQVRFTRPDKRNALDRAQFAAIIDVGEALRSRADVRAVVLSGQGESFCAGLDFSIFGDMADGGATEHTPGDPAAMMPNGLTHTAQQICWIWQELPMPVIAAMHGHALGGGLQMALGADIRVAHPDTNMAVREMHWGITPDMTATFILAKLVREDIARELTYTARIFDGAEAHQLGLVTHLADDPLTAATALATEIAQRNPAGVRGAKTLFTRQFHQGAAAQFAAEREQIMSLIGTPNQVEAITANMEQRAPVFADPDSK